MPSLAGGEDAHAQVTLNDFCGWWTTQVLLRPMTTLNDFKALRSSVHQKELYS